MRYQFPNKSMDKNNHYQNQTDDDDDDYSVISVSSSSPAPSPPHSLSYDSSMVLEPVIPPQNPYNNNSDHVSGRGGSSRRAVEQQVTDNQNLGGVQELGNVKLDKSTAVALSQGGFTQRVDGNINEGPSQRIGNFEVYNGSAQSRMTSEHNHNHNNRHPPTARPYAAPRPSPIVFEINAIGNRNLKGQQSAGNVKAEALPLSGQFVVNANGNYNEGELQDVGNIAINFVSR